MNFYELWKPFYELLKSIFISVIVHTRFTTAIEYFIDILFTLNFLYEMFHLSSCLTSYFHLSRQTSEDSIFA